MAKICITGRGVILKSNIRSLYLELESEIRLATTSTSIKLCLTDTPVINFDLKYYDLKLHKLFVSQIKIGYQMQSS